MASSFHRLGAQLYSQPYSLRNRVYPVPRGIISNWNWFQNWVLNPGIKSKIHICLKIPPPVQGNAMVGDSVPQDAQLRVGGWWWGRWRQGQWTAGKGVPNAPLCWVKRPGICLEKGENSRYCTKLWIKIYRNPPGGHPPPCNPENLRQFDCGRVCTPILNTTKNSQLMKAFLIDWFKRGPLYLP